MSTAPSYAETLAQIAAERPDVVVLTAENRATIRALPAQLGPRFIDVGICEQTLVATAAGLASRGRVPVVHALAAFLTMRAFEFVRTDLGHADLPALLVGFVPGFLSAGNGFTHQAIEDIALMRLVPNMRIVCPADREELCGALPLLVDSGAPCYLRYHDADPLCRHNAPFALGVAESLGEGDDVALLTYGMMLAQSVQAQALLRAEGIACRVLNLRTLVPLDEAAVLAALRACRLCVTVEDHLLCGGLATQVAELGSQAGLCPQLLPIALAGRSFVPAPVPDLLVAEAMDGPQLAARIRHHWTHMGRS
ncbi:MAG: transketolase family protein [Polyangiales bacterium]